MNTAPSLIHLFQRQAMVNPAAIAVSCSEQTLTYKALFQRADQLAYHMIASGVQQGAKIGIYVERSLEIFIAILATLKIGAAYVPIDPNYPRSRIQYMLKAGNISALITQAALLLSLPVTVSNIICLDRDWPLISKYHPKDLIFKSPKSSEDLLAYVLYTSGSTGTPKGVMINQSNLVNAYFGWQKAYELTAQDVHLQMASFSFDVFSGDLVRALCSGSKLVLCPREILLNPAALYTLMKQEKITCAEFVPAVLRKLVEYLIVTHQDLSFMRLLICGSDNWSIGEYKKFKSLCGKKTRLINSYGLTEATIDSTYFEMDTITEANFLDEDSVPIGKPFANTVIYLLDEVLNPVEAGTVGEIYIAGPSLASGYVNQLELTQQKFIQHLINGKSIRFYKTGDMGRCLSDGNIQLVGRLDNQVKLYGHRIELTEIENNLNQHPAIIESLVTLQNDINNHRKLVAYVVFKEGITVDIKILRAFLRQHLPNYMLPALFLPVPSLPLLPNGKLNRQFFTEQTLIVPAMVEQNSFNNETVQKIIESLKSYISTDEVAMHDSFLDLGMDSLALANFVCVLNKQFKTDIGSCQLSTHTTLESLAKIIETAI